MTIPDIDINKIGGFYMFLAVMAVTFCIFSLIYNDKYIYLGFYTFIYCILSQLWDICFHHLFIKKENKEKPFALYFLLQLVFLLIYLYLLVWKSKV